MYESKINLVMALPGRVMMSEQECSRKVKKALVKKGKQILKNGKPVWYTTTEPINCDVHQIEISKDETIVVYTRRNRPASRVLNVCKEAYKEFIGSFVPNNYIMPKNFKAPMIEQEAPSGKKIINPKYPGVPLKTQSWLELSQEERLEWHLKNLCYSLGGVLESYTILEDA
jgi:hypothetical protein